MTQKNGTIEFIKEEGQAPHVYINEIKKLVSFDKMSKKLFTYDPAVIKKLDSLGYKRGKIKIDGVAVLASNMTDDEAKRAQRSLERQAEKVGIEPPKIKVEEIEVDPIEEKVEIEDIVISEVENSTESKEENSDLIDEKKVEEKVAKKAKKKKFDSSKLKKEIESK